MSTRAEVLASHQGYLLALGDFEVLKTMSRSERKARARKYRDTALEIAEPLVIQTDSWNFYVQSDTSPQTFHHVSYESAWKCECYAYQKNGTCKHKTAVEKYIKFRGETGGK